MAAVEKRLRHWGAVSSYRLAARTSAGRGSRRRGLGEFCFARFFDAEPDRVKCG